MKLQILGTAAAEGIPALFCTCEYCKKARQIRGKEIRTRSGARISISRSCHKEFENAYFTVLFGKDSDAL